MHDNSSVQYYLEKEFLSTNNFGMTNFRLDICICIVTAMIFIHKYLVNFCEIICNELLKGKTIRITNIL